MKNSSTPPISVVMSVYNGSHYLKEAIQSILSQTYSNFEFIIVNDGSIDDSKKIIESYQDSRIVLIDQKNKGLVESLNTAIKKAAGTYIARQDADDASRPDRLKTQLRYMQTHPSHVLIGSSMKVMDESSTVLHTHHVLLNNTELKQELLVRSPFAHGSVMFRKDKALESGLYRKEFWPAEDYEFWLRLSVYGELANINDPLYVYRENTQGISASNSEVQIQKTSEIQDLAWTARYRLVSDGPIDYAAYAGIRDGRFRIERIRNNLKHACFRALKTGNIKIAVRLLRLAGYPRIAHTKVSK